MSSEKIFKWWLEFIRAILALIAGLLGGAVS